jgi:hypothetical protein
MAGKRVADALREVEAARKDIKKLKFVVFTTAAALAVSVGTLTYIISQM